jgi:hypothetical protein
LVQSGFMDNYFI